MDKVLLEIYETEEEDQVEQTFVVNGREQFDWFKFEQPWTKFLCKQCQSEWYRQH